MWVSPDALLAERSDDVAAALGDDVAVLRFEAALPDALAGSFGAVRELTAAWNDLLERTLATARKILPDQRIVVENGAVVEVCGRRVGWLHRALQESVAEAAVAPFVRHYGAGRGLALGCVSRVRSALCRPGIAEPTDGPPSFEGPVDMARFHRLVDLALRGQAPPLERIQGGLGLSNVELAELFGVSRQALEQWRTRGVPADRRDKLADVVAVVDLLERKLRPERLPLVARRPVAAFAGRSILEMAANDHRGLRSTVEAAFDWSANA